MSKLQQLAKKRREEGRTSIISNLNHTTNSLDSLLKRKKLDTQQKQVLQQSPIIQIDIPSEIQNNNQIEVDVVNDDNNDLPHKRDFSFTIPNTHSSSKLLISDPTHILPTIIFSSLPVVKRRKLNLNINIPITLADKIKKNFEKPRQESIKPEIIDPTDTINNVTEKIAKVQITKPKLKINLNDEINKKSSKPLLSVIVIGHVDSGKSTTIGRLLYDLKIVDSRTMHKLTKEAEQSGKGSFSLAWIMDQTSEERQRGVTIDIVQTQFETQSQKFNIIDSPGHKDYLPQMINGITQADTAIIIVDAASDHVLNFTGSTFEQLRIAKSMGINEIIVVINKMDLINWDKSRFDLINETIIDYLSSQLNYNPISITCIPISGFNGDNVVNLAIHDWYKGDSLIKVLETANLKFDHQSRANPNDHFDISITDISGSDTGSLLKKSDTLIIHGRIRSGHIQPGESVKIWPSEQSAIVDSVTTTSTVIGSTTAKIVEKVGIAGDFVELKLKKLEMSEQISIGDVLTKVGEPDVTVVEDVILEMEMFEMDRVLLAGSRIVLFRGVIGYDAVVKEVCWVSIDGKRKKRMHVAANQKCKIVVTVERGVCLSARGGKADRVVLRREGVVVGGGIIKN